MCDNLQKADSKSKPKFSDLQNHRLQYAGMERHERLRLARKRHFATAKEAAVSLGLPYGTYSGHESGSRGIKDDELSLYARRFRVSIGWLAFGEGEFDDSTSFQPAIVGGRSLIARETGNDDQPGEDEATWTHTRPTLDKTYIQVEIGALRSLVSGVLQNESIPEEQADAYADAVLALLREQSVASLVLRLVELTHNAAGSPRPELDDRP